MIGAMFALALQASDPPAAASPPPAPHNAADAIADILAQTPQDAPAVVAAPPIAKPAPAAPSVTGAPAQPAPVPVPSIPPPAAVVQAPPPVDSGGAAARYESSVRSSFAARQARQGGLDGRWMLTDADGKGLYIFQLADPGPGRGPVEGAWRDLAREGAADASGFIDQADRSAQGLTLVFREAGPCTVTLTLGADGRWTGQIRAADQVVRPVVMTRS